MGIGLTQQKIKRRSVGAVHERPGSTRSVFAFARAHSQDAGYAAGRFVNRPYGERTILAD